MSGLMEATEAMWTGTRDSSDKQAWEQAIRRGMQQAVRLSDKIIDRKTLGVWQIKTRFAHAKVVVVGGGDLRRICHTRFLCQNQVLIVCMTQDQLFHICGQKCSQITKCHE
jgi:hypothetical protein